MIDQKAIKKEAKKSIKKHYFRSIILVYSQVDLTLQQKI